MSTKRALSHKCASGCEQKEQVLACVSLFSGLAALLFISSLYGEYPTFNCWKTVLTIEDTTTVVHWQSFPSHHAPGDTEQEAALPFLLRTTDSEHELAQKVLEKPILLMPRTHMMSNPGTVFL
jgi:hypothetical protein